MAVGGNAAKTDARELSGMGDRDADELLTKILPTFGEGRIERANGLENLFNDLVSWTAGQKLPREGEVGKLLGAFLEPGGDVMPDWLKEPDGTVSETSWRRIENAQHFFQRFEMTAMVVLGCASLPHCYWHPEIASTLVLSGRLAAQVKKRLGETADFLRAAMKPESLRHGSAVPWIRKVRLMHAIMRQLTLQPAADHQKRRGFSTPGFLLKKQWHRRADQMPVDQLELGYVLLTFSLVVLEGWNTLGIHTSDEVDEDYLLAWRVVGHVLGVEKSLLDRCSTLAGARALFAEVKDIQTHLPVLKGADLDGRLLTVTLLVLLAEYTLAAGKPYYGHKWLGCFGAWLQTCFRTLPRSLMRRLLDSRTTGYLWIEAPPLFQQLAHWAFIFAIMGRDAVRTRLSKRSTETGTLSAVGGHVKRLGRLA